MKKILLLSVVIVLLVCILAPSAALADGQKVYDNAELFTPEETAMLEETIDAYISVFDSDLAVVTITDDQGKTSMAYADDFYDQNGFGKNGMLFLINMDSRDLYISTSGGMIDILNDDRIDRLLDLQYEYVSNEDYYGAVQRSIEQVESYMDAGPVSGQYTQPVSSRNLTADWIAISILIGAGIAGLVVLIIYKQYKKEYKTVPYDYRKEAKLVLNTTIDNLIDTHTTSRYIPPPDSSSGYGSSGSGRSSTHSSSSGSTHGGGGRSF